MRLDARERSHQQDHLLWRGEDFVALMRGRAHTTNVRPGDVLFGLGAPQVDVTNLRAAWVYRHFNAMHGIFIDFSEPCERIAEVRAQGALAMAHPQPSHTLHLLFLDEAKEKLVSEWFRRAFGVGICVNRVGAHVSLHVGASPELGVGETQWSMTYAARLAALPQIETQGHGMRAYLAAILKVLLVPRFVDLVDEPEAFLHPPQARLLAQTLVSEKPAHKQLIMATHSADILRGACDAPSARVSVVRITRDGDRTIAHRLEAAQLREIWADPLLDFSNVLDGLFHDLVVVCEGDADCRFYSAILRATTVEAKRPDVLFTWCGGKGRVAKVVSALQKVGVRCHAAVDFDVLNDAGTLQKLVAAFGHPTDDLLKQRNIVATSLAQKSSGVLKAQAREQICTLIDAVDGEEVDKETIQEIRAVLRRTSPWQFAKEAGIASIPRGPAQKAALALLADLAQAGVFVVPIGELECFCRSVPLDGPAWVARVLEEKNLATDPELEDARRYVRALVGIATATTETRAVQSAPA